MGRIRKKIACVDVSESFVKLILRFVENRYDFEFTTDTDANYVLLSGAWTYSSILEFVFL